MSHMQIKNWMTDAVIYEGEAESLKDLVGSAIKSKADLRYADLRSANLRSANLSSADLSYANLSYQHIFSFSGIGSARRLTNYLVEADKVFCGCFTGTMDEFIAQVKETHENNPRHLAEYLAGIAFLKACAEAIPEEKREAGKKEYEKMIAKKESK